MSSLPPHRGRALSRRASFSAGDHPAPPAAAADLGALPPSKRVASEAFPSSDATAAAAAAAAAVDDARLRAQLAQAHSAMQAQFDAEWRVREGQMRLLTAASAPAAAPAPGGPADATAAAAVAALSAQLQQVQRQLAALQTAAPHGGASSQSAAPAAFDPLAFARELRRAQLTAAPLALPPFRGHGEQASSLEVTRWLRTVEALLDTALAGVGLSAAQAGSDPALQAWIVGSAAAALQGEARCWWTDQVAAGAPPRDWPLLKAQLLSRYQLVASFTHHLERLERLAAVAARGGRRMDFDALRRYATRFQDAAALLPAVRVPDCVKAHIFARGLPDEARKVALAALQDADDPAKPLPSLAEVAQRVIAKATLRHSAGALAHADAPGGARDAMDLTSVSASASAEDWDFLFPSCGAGRDEREREDLAAATARPRYRDRSPGRERAARGRPGRVPSDVANSVPAKLTEGRIAAGLCVRCGVAKYAPGRQGHNSIVCRAPVDTSTTVEAGKAKAGLNFQ